MSREGSTARLPPHRAGVFVLGKFLQQREELGFPLAFGSKTLPWVDALKEAGLESSSSSGSGVGMAVMPSSLC